MTPRRWLSHPLVSIPISIPLLFPPPLFLSFLLLLIFVPLPPIRNTDYSLSLFTPWLTSPWYYSTRWLGRTYHNSRMGVCNKRSDAWSHTLYMIKCYEAMAPLKSFLTSGLATGPTCSVNQQFIPYSPRWHYYLFISQSPGLCRPAANWIAKCWISTNLLLLLLKIADMLEESKIIRLPSRDNSQRGFLSERKERRSARTDPKV